MKFISPILHFALGLGYFAPLAMGVLDSSFLVLPFGNDLLIIGLVVNHHRGAPWYVLSAACGSTIGVLLLALVSRKLGEKGVRAIAGEKRYKKLENRIGNWAALTTGVVASPPPPFPFTVVIAAVAAVDYPIWKILVFTFLARIVRFAALAVLAFKFGNAVTRIAKSEPFQWAMIVFIGLCAIASGYSIWRWLRRSRGKQR
jgi:membrane protein YqaA with SNARE-associated domain